MNEGGETTRIRHMIAPFIVGMDGVDLGYGGDSISPSAINVDQVNPYAMSRTDHPQHLHGDASKLHWFADHVLDYVYSSHLLEDFPMDQTASVIHEWMRVIKVGGLLILYLPNEQRFRKHCDATGQSYNNNHQNPDMALEYMHDKILHVAKYGFSPERMLEFLYEWDDKTAYSFLTVVKVM